MITFQDYTLVMDLGRTGIQEVTLMMKSPSSLSFVETELPAGAFKEASLGYYNLSIPKSLIQETGTYVFRVIGYELEKFFERECLPKPLSSVAPPDLCIVTGNLRDICGRSNAFSNSEIIVRPLKLPETFSGTMVLGQRIVALSDFDGFFSVPVIRGAKVMFEIKDAGLRFQATIPSEDTVRIEDLMP